MGQSLIYYGIILLKPFLILHFMQKYFFTLILACLLLVIVESCKDTPDPPIDPPITDTTPTDTLPSYPTTFVPADNQRPGDPAVGYQYLTEGNYLMYGIPYDIFQATYGNIVDAENLLGRTGDNANVPYNFTAVTAPNGVRVVSPNCLQCHAQKLNGELIVGLGNSLGDYTVATTGLFPIIDNLITITYGQNSPEWEAYEPFRTPSATISPYIMTECKGVNPADRIFGVLAAYRDSWSLEWLGSPQFTTVEQTAVTDVPAWWQMNKKNVMLYNTAGRGDLARIMMASSLLTMKDSSEARQIDHAFPDVVSYIQSLEAPSFPEVVDQELADQGKTVFEQNCQMCHGVYGTNGYYPNLLLSKDVVGTDPLLASVSSNESALANWYNAGWFGSSDSHGVNFVNDSDGYIAPPLNGIWATAPYLHNGSVPDLYTLLNSTSRPTYWRRSFNDDDYSFQTVGWNYTEVDAASASETDVYDTTIEGYQNIGHTYGDVLTPEQRDAVVEYLKTL